MESNTFETIKQNSRFNIFKCNICGNYFKNKYELKRHMERKNKCGLICQDDVINDIKEEFNRLMDLYESFDETSFEKTEKTDETASAKQKEKLYKKITGKFNAIERYGNMDSDELRKAKQYLNEIKK